MINPSLLVRTSLVLLTLLVALPTDLAHGQKIKPTHQDLPYANDHRSQRLDVYLAQSDHAVPAMVFIHGGGWRAGSKDNVPQWLLQAVADGWLSVISVEYRFTDVAPHPAQTSDCLRAIQFVRQHAAKWKIDPDRIGVTGGSAGGHLSLWVALHDDVADPKSTDPVSQRSSRVACAVSFAGPTDWSLLSELEHGHPAYRQLLGYEPDTPASKMDADAIRNVSPISFVSPDDPPIMQVHGDADAVVPIEHAKRLHRQLRAAGVVTELVVIPGGTHSVAGAAGTVSARANQFTREILAKHPSPQE